jgi:hypothetical protein
LTKNEFMVWKTYYWSRTMSKPTLKTPSLDYILNKISDHETLTLFNTIALSNVDSGQLKGMNMTAKKYYSRISRLMDSGLIKRHKGTYSLTLLGKIVYSTHLTINQTLNYYWKLKAIESIQEASTSGTGVRLGEKELSKLIDILIDNHQIKDILIKELHVLEDKSMTSTSTSSKSSLLSTTKQKSAKVGLTDSFE